MAKPPAPPKAPSRAKAPAAPKAPQGPKVGKTQGPPPVALRQVTVHRIGVPLPTIPTPKAFRVGANTHVVHHPVAKRHRIVHKVGPNTHLVITPPNPRPGGPRGAANAVGAAMENERNGALRYSGNPKAFRFGAGRRKPSDGGDV